MASHHQHWPQQTLVVSGPCMNRLGQVFEQLPGKPDEHLGGRGEARLPAGDEGEGLIERRVKGVPVQIAVDPSACANGKEITVSPTPRSARAKARAGDSTSTIGRTETPAFWVSARS